MSSSIRVGIGLPSFGPGSGPEAIASVASAADRLGFDSVSLTERILLPATPGWTNEFGLPESPVLDPIETLTWAAAHSTRVRLATGIVNSLFQPPVMLARRLATLDVLSGGRLDLGIGQGWMPEEFAAVGVPISRRGAGFEEHLAAMRACWGPDPVEHAGPRYPIARARIGPKPVNGRIPVYIGALVPAAVERAARIGDGFITAVRDIKASATEIQNYRAAGGLGAVVLRGVPPGIDAGSEAEPIARSMAEYSEQAADIGADEVHFDLTLAGVPIAAQLASMDRFAQLRR